MKSAILIFIFSLIIVQPKSLAQNLTERQLQKIEGLAHNVDVDENYRNGSWEAVLDVMTDKNIVLLGEMNHGSKEIFETRNELIKELHQKLGFDVILFESGIGEVGTMEIQQKPFTIEQMTFGFFGGWRTSEFKDLMGYVKENRLFINGFDVQKTGNAFNALLEEKASSKSIDSVFYYNLEQRFDYQKSLLTKRNAIYDSILHSTQELINEYQVFFNLLNKDPQENDTNTCLLIKRTIENRITYLSYFLEFVRTKDWNKRWKDRDEMMASNVEWLIENFYKDKKIIIVAHNFHIARHNEKEKVMGEFLIKKYNSQMYVLGVFAGSGSYADNSGTEKQMQPIVSEAMDIKKIILSLPGKVNFINIDEAKSIENEILFNEIIVNDTFIDLAGSNKLNLSKHFDGLLLIDKISPAK